jgi:SAM-dependent methyltransferase
MDIRAYNRQAWDKSVEEGSEWTVPVDAETIRAARRGEWKIVLTPVKPVPRAWFPPLPGLEVLCLASGGGQQGPVLAAAGAQVTVFDNSPRQLAQDRLVAEREGLKIETVEGDMRDLSAFAAERFGLIVHPVSNLFVPEIRPVWRECWRVLRPGGALLAGFMNPAFYIFDRDQMDEQGILQVKYTLPYSDLTSVAPEKLARYLEQGWPLEFGHTLEEQIGGQLEAGFVLTGFYEDRDPRSVLDDYMPVYLATRAVKR